MQAAVKQISSDSTPTANANLSPAQAQVVAALAQGYSVTAAAQEAGVHRTTIHHWLRTEPEFKTAVVNAEREYVEILRDEMRELSYGALQSLHTLLEDPDTKGAVRLKAALAILQRPHFPDQAWHLPVRIESPREQAAMDMLAQTKADERVTR